MDMSDERYQSKTYIGAGGMATVYRAWDSVVGRDVALKEIAEELRDDDEVRKMFIAEARKMAQVRHRHVVQVYDVLLDNNVPTIVQEFMDGGSLANRVGASVMTPDETLNMLQDVFHGLRAIHEAGLVHRDMKPDNILAGNGDWKVADFGVAMSGEEDVLPFIGSKYAAPEVLNAPDTISARSDIYSMGILSMELMLGSEQFEAAAREAMLLKQGGGNSARDSAAAFWQRWVSSDAEVPLLCDLNPVISREVSEFVARLAARDASKRPASCDEVIAEIDQLRKAEALRMGAPTERDPKVKSGKAAPDTGEGKKKKTPLWFKITAGVGVLLLAAVGALLIGSSRPRTFDIALISEPAGASITVNGMAQEALTPSVVPLQIGDVIELSLPRHHGVNMTLAKGMPGLQKSADDKWEIISTLERAFSLDSSKASQAYLADLWQDAPDLRATVPSALDSTRPYRLPLGTPLYIAITPPAEGALTFIHLSSDDIATLVYPDPTNATLGVLARKAVTVGDELDMVAHEPLGREWIILVLSRNPLTPPDINGSGLIEDWARYYEFGSDNSPAEQLMTWLVDTVGKQPLGFAIVPIEIVPASTEPVAELAP